VDTPVDKPVDSELGIVDNLAAAVDICAATCGWPPGRGALTCGGTPG